VFGRRPQESSSLLGKAVSSSTGNWRLANGTVPFGEYYATVVTRNVAQGTCKGTLSAMITLAPQPAVMQPPVPPSVPLTCDPGYVPGHIPGVAPEFCIPAHGPVLGAVCAIGFHTREHYPDQCVPNAPPSARQ
jgi:hypothetical protein